MTTLNLEMLVYQPPANARFEPVDVQIKGKRNKTECCDRVGLQLTLISKYYLGFSSAPRDNARILLDVRPQALSSS